MNIFKIFGIMVFSLALYEQNVSIANNTLKDSIAKLMNINQKDIKLKKQKFGMNSSQNYIFEANNQKYVLKLFKKRTKLEFRKNEIESVKIFSKLGLGAKLIAVAEDNSFYIREYTDGKIVKSSDFQNQKFLINFAKALKKLHDYDTDITSPKSLEYCLEKHYQSIIKKKIALPSNFEKVYKECKELYLKLPKRKGFCHNNLNPHNIIISENGNISFIDLVNCGISNIYEELGYVTLLCGIFDKNLQLFLENYLGTQASQKEFEVVKLAQKLVSFLTSLVWFDFSETKKDKKISIEERQQFLDDLLKSKDFKSAEDFIKDGKIVSIKSRNKLLVKQYALAFYKNYLQL